MCTILLFKNRIYNTINGWLKESSKKSPKNISIRHIQVRIKLTGKDTPHQLQLTKANVVVLVIVSSRSKFYVFRFLRIPKPKFSCLVKTTDDMIQIIDKN